MDRRFKIEVPKPCHEDWDKMMPDGNARFCNSCARNVVDFTKMDASQIQDYFIQNQGKKLCGMFASEHIDSIAIAIPRQALFSQAQFHKIFLLALFVTMGTTLFSCSDANGDKRAIDTIEVTDTVVERRTMGIPLPPKIDSATVAIEKPGKWATPGRTKGEVVLKPAAAKVTVYKDSITMSGAK
jgi:hypothetical protein